MASTPRRSTNPPWSANPRPLRDTVPAALPLWREGFAIAEFSLLPLAPIYHGIGAPRGDGAAVVVVPGFSGTDGYLAPMRRWLGRIGYVACASGVGHNANCLERLGNRLIETLETAADTTGRRVHVVGHSLGGVLSRGVACLRPDLVASVTTMGSPIRGVRSHPLVMRLVDVVRRSVVERDGGRNPKCFTGDCRCDIVRAVQGVFPEEIPQLAIYTRGDGVLAWRYSRLRDPSKNAEVLGTHCGLAANPQAYRHLARFLSRNPSPELQAPVASPETSVPTP